MTYEIHHCPRGDWHTRAFCSECFEPRGCGGGKSERMLKCAHCGVTTLHIVAGEKNPNDPYDYGTPGPAKLIDPEAAIRAAGLRPVYVERLGREAWLVVEASLVLIDASLTPDRVLVVTREVLDEWRGQR